MNGLVEQRIVHQDIHREKSLTNGLGQEGRNSRRGGHENNLIDARASGFCFQRNDQPEPHRLLNQRSRHLSRAPRGALAGAVLWCPLVGVSGAVLVQRSFFSAQARYDRIR